MKNRIGLKSRSNTGRCMTARRVNFCRLSALRGCRWYLLCFSAPHRSVKRCGVMAGVAYEYEQAISCSFLDEGREMAVDFCKALVMLETGR